MLIEYNGRKYNLELRHHRSFLLGQLKFRLEKAQKAEEENKDDSEKLQTILEAKGKLINLIERIEKIHKESL